MGLGAKPQVCRELCYYIFINDRLRVQDCQLILNQPASHSRTLYPSDHFGIAADLEILPDPI